MAILCPLCRSTNCKHFFSNKDSDYLNCAECDLVFVPEQFHLDLPSERARYDSHRNDPNDKRYRKFLSKIFEPLVCQISKPSRGLDFGCGPGPTLSVMFEDAGHEVDLFDKFYNPNKEIFNNKYDFITATEVLEHLHSPGIELKRLFGMLHEGGRLGVMTRILSEEIDFQSWFYKDDPTHICFYSNKTMNYLANKYSCSVKFYSNDVAIFSK